MTRTCHRKGSDGNMHGTVRGQTALEKGDLPNWKRRRVYQCEPLTQLSRCFLFHLAQKSQGQMELFRLHPAGTGNIHPEPAQRGLEVIGQFNGNK